MAELILLSAAFLVHGVTAIIGLVALVSLKRKCFNDHPYIFVAISWIYLFFSWQAGFAAMLAAANFMEDPPNIIHGTFAGIYMFPGGLLLIFFFVIAKRANFDQAVPTPGSIGRAFGEKWKMHRR